MKAFKFFTTNPYDREINMNLYETLVIGSYMRWIDVELSNFNFEVYTNLSLREVEHEVHNIIQPFLFEHNHQDNINTILSFLSARFHRAQIKQNRKVAVFCQNHESFTDFYRRMIAGRRHYTRLNGDVLFTLDNDVFYLVSNMNQTRGRIFTHYIDNTQGDVRFNTYWSPIIESLRGRFNIQQY